MRILCIGAHPDDCEIEFGGTAAKFAARGDEVKFVSMTNGNGGHHIHPPEKIAAIRKLETQESARRLGLAAYDVLDNHDAQLLPDLARRDQVIRQIRGWRADLVLTHRACDYHPDHRYTGQLVQDAAYLVVVPHVCPEVKPLESNPVFAYLEDTFQFPAPFVPDVTVSIEDVWQTKLSAMDAHPSQFYEWLPWVDHITDVPTDKQARIEWLSQQWTRPLSPAVQARAKARYGRELVHAESFQLCEYGRRLSAAELDQVFPR